MTDEHVPNFLKPDRPAVRPWTIGLLVGSAEDKYENALLRGISDVVRPAGSNLICFTSGTLRSYHGFEAQRNVLYDLISATRVDGLIISGTLGHSVTPTDLLDFCRRYQPLPLVSVAVSLADVPSVMVDSRQGMQAIMRHLWRNTVISASLSCVDHAASRRLKIGSTLTGRCWKNMAYRSILI